MTTYIYGLICPISKQINYVGMSKDVDRRFKDHMADKKNSDKVRWLQSLQTLGLQPSVVIMSEVEDGVARIEEARWILFGLQGKWPLKNDDIPSSDLFVLPEVAPNSALLETLYKYDVPDTVAQVVGINAWGRFLRAKPTFEDALCVDYLTMDYTRFNVYYALLSITRASDAHSGLYGKPVLNVIWYGMHQTVRERAPTVKCISCEKKIGFRLSTESAQI